MKRTGGKAFEAQYIIDKPVTMNEESLNALLARYLDGTCSDEERQAVEDWYEQLCVSDEHFYANDSFAVEASRIKSLESIAQRTWRIPRKRIIPLRFIGVAAAVLGLGITFYYMAPVKTNKQSIAKTEILPGGNAATITLDNGKTFNLDHVDAKVLAENTNAVIKQDSGKIVYASSTSTEVVHYNTIATPRGGQYILQLPDGTGVWLNAASSIKFPTSFTGNTREVELTGEGYFEVNKNPAKPFHVKVRNTEIMVLGTHFNVNAYEDESSLHTTLLEGSVKIKAGLNEKLLRPGEQAAVIGNSITIQKMQDADAVIAWKDGAFSLQRTSTQELLRQIARWYNITVVYKGHVPAGSLSGEIPRNLSLSEVRKTLELNGIHTSLSERTLTVLPN